MKFSSLITLLSCHSLDDFPSHYEGIDAARLLASWSSPWHPRLIVAAQSLPKWMRSDQAPQIDRDGLLVIPFDLNGAEAWKQRCQEVGGRCVIGATSRSLIWRELGLESLPPPTLDPSADDFAALAYAYLQVQLMTRRLHYTWALDESHFAATVLSAAAAWTQGDSALARSGLQSAFDLLLAERNKAYPVDAHLIELVLISPQADLEKEIEPGKKRNYLIPMETARSLAGRAPSDWQRLLDQVEQGAAQIITGPARELPDICLSLNSVVREIVAGREQAVELCGRAAAMYGRWTGGLHPSLPQILNGLGFRQALHLAFDGSRVPPASGSTINWRGPSADSIDALAGRPIGAAVADRFASLAVQIGEQIDSAHQATVVFVRQAGESGEVFEDLRRASRFNCLLGKFVTCEELFDHLYHPGYGDSFDYDDYRNGYLAEWAREARSDCLSSSVNYWTLYANWLSLRNLNSLLAFGASSAAEFDRRLNEVLVDIHPLAVPPRGDQLTERGETLRRLREQLLEIRSGLNREVSRLFSSPTGSLSAVGWLNPSFAPLRVCRDSSGEAFAVGPPLIVQAQSGMVHQALIDLPAAGLAILATTPPTQPVERQPEMIVEPTLRNEFFEIEIDRQTGGIRAARKPGSRINLFSQQLAWYQIADCPPGGEPAESQSEYSAMRAERVEFEVLDPLRSRVVSTGSLWDGTIRRGDFRQTVCVSRGSRQIELDVEFDLPAPPRGEPWRDYVSSRLAWNEDAMDRFRGVHDSHQPLRLEKFAAPTYVHIENGYLPITLFTKGLPFHRQSALRILDTLLIVAGETGRQFQFSIGLGVAHPQNTWLHSYLEPIRFETRADSNQSSRIFHLSQRNVVVIDSWPNFHDSGECSGVTLRLRETCGRRGDLTIHSPRPLKGAKALDLTGRSLEGLAVHDDQVHLEYHEFKLFTVQMFW